MKTFFKTSLLILLTAVFFQSCTSNESDEELVSNEIETSTNLAEKIIATATSKNDLSIVNPECAPTTLGLNSSLLFCYFRNPQGDYYSMDIPMTSWEESYQEKKELAYEETGIRFTDDDFFIQQVLVGVTFIIKPENIVNYFETCEYGSSDHYNDDPNFKVSLSEINFDCDASVIAYVDGNPLFSREKINLSDGISFIENELITYNTSNSTSHTLDDVYVSNLYYTSPSGTEGYSIKREEILNYFDGCSLDRDINDNDCLNFVYPLQVNRSSLSSGETTSTTIENDDDLATTFSTNTDELTFIYPINLLGQDGTVLTIENDEALENALDSSANYCY